MTDMGVQGKMTIQYWEGASFRPRDWQEKALPEIIKCLKQGKKPVVSAIMGAGKSVLIAELIWVAFHKLKEGNKILVTAPRQSLVTQLHKTIANRLGEENVGMFFTYIKEPEKPIIITCNASAGNLSLKLSGAKISLLIGDEVHGTEADSFKFAYSKFQPACSVGFTATPYRSNKKQTLTLWDSVAYRYSAGDALRDKVIVPWNLVHWNGRHAHAEEVDKICIDLIRMHCKGPGIVSAIDIEDAEYYAEYVGDFGYKAAAIHSRIPKDKRAEMLQQLENGELDMLVHVSLLAEGVDLPFLRWLCLRRPVQARVRFVQEVGRVLRSYPGKTIATILDPHDLFSLHGLQNEEALGEIIAVDPDEEELASLVKDKVERDKIIKMPPAKAVGHLESWVKRMLSTMRACGVCRPAKKEWTWGEDTVSTQSQRDRVLKLRFATRWLPGYVRGDFKMLLHEDKLIGFKAEMVSNIIDILIGLAGSARGHSKRHVYWHFPNIPLPKLSAPIAGLLFKAARYEDLHR